MASITFPDIPNIAAAATSAASAAAASGDNKCSLRSMDGNIKIAVIALAAMSGVLCIALLLTCCESVCKKKRKRKVEIRVAIRSLGNDEDEPRLGGSGIREVIVIAARGSMPYERYHNYQISPRSSLLVSCCRIVWLLAASLNSTRVVAVPIPR
ncbi:hypothetical protein FB567DRAFT_553300 [Paraphoma chrysanthemicola]|uniref:Uncharacterized protein n=1 Tax=Paraphoma chrysanthemicola TaxID=798071 RepID=A0A8K0VTP9_9PLEO|nr:hypothetical protein FB567DRAFT_553300 [Paraphoma chrysanthemicola]